MEGSSPECKLLEESQKGSQFSFKTTNDELCDWLSIERKPAVRLCSAEQHGKRCFTNHKEQSSSGDIYKDLRWPHRRYTSRASWSRNNEQLQVKFEHFSSSSQYIDKYRKAKKLRLEAVLNKLVEHKARTSKLSQRADRPKSVSERQGKLKAGATSPIPSYASCPELERQEGCNQQLNDSANPSLPQTGCFTGKKWVYPKDIDSCKNICRTKRGSKLQVKKPNIQVFDVRNIFLQGKGKPLNSASNKMWVVPRQATVCSSAPVSHQKPPKEMSSPNCLAVPKPRKNEIRPSSQNKTTDYTDFNSIVEGLHETKLASDSPQIFESSSKLGTAVGNSHLTTKEPSLEYGNMFKNVIDLYGDCKHDTRSHIYVRIGT